MATVFGVDTLTSRLDLITWTDFSTWNGGTTAAFAGRPFLGDRFLWGRGEATNSRTNPHPEDPSLLNLVGPELIAPIQSANKTRQQLTGMRGFLAGAIDGQALCRRVVSGVLSGEFSMPLDGSVNLWLTVDPTVDFASEYWSGWADAVNGFPAASVPHMQGPPLGQPFLASILCQYTRNAANLLVPDANVTLALQSPVKHRNTRLWAYWADAALPDTTDGVKPNPTVDFIGNFDPKTVPLTWRIGTGVAKADGTAVNDQFSVDAVLPSVLPLLPDATDFMLTANKWQPTIPGVLNLGVSASLTGAAPNDHVTAAQVTCLQNTPLPAMPDILNAALTFPSVNVSTVGRYVEQTDQQGHLHNTNQAEVQLMNGANIAVFSCWEKGTPNNTEYFNPANNRGTTDGQRAMQDCGDTLQQPPQTPIFFAVDYDAGDPSPVSGGGPNAKAYITDYFSKVAATRDTYFANNPDRYFLIGVYAAGAVLEWLYEQGIVSYFWQSPSTGTAGNQPPNRPWYHANRWQFRGIDANHPFPGGWNCISGADPDADWGDGGSWFLNDDLNQQLIDMERWAQFVGWDAIDPPSD